MILISMKTNSILQLLFHTIPPPLDQYNLFWSYKKRAPKPLLGRQNCVTSTVGRHNFVPGLHWYRRGPAWSVIYGEQDGNQVEHLGKSCNYLGGMSL